MKFIKMQGTGNDFILIDTRGLSRDWTGLARRMCHRHFGVGADGLLLVSRGNNGFRMQMFNPDGSEAEVCGNGLRCVGKFLVEEGYAWGKEIEVETSAGVKTLRPRLQGGRVREVAVGMGAPRLQAREVPLAISSLRTEPSGRSPASPILNYPMEIAGRQLSLSFVSMGNPHAICFVEETVAAFPLTEIGPQVEHHPLFPQRTNFEVVRVLGRDRVEARVWERGAGETLSCGSGACAIGVAARLHSLVDSPVEVSLPGGTLTVAWEEGGEVELQGPAAVVFKGDWLEED